MTDLQRRELGVPGWGRMGDECRYGGYMSPIVAVFHFVCPPVSDRQYRWFASLLCHLSFQIIVQIQLRANRTFISHRDYTRVEKKKYLCDRLFAINKRFINFRLYTFPRDIGYMLGYLINRTNCWIKYYNYLHTLIVSRTMQGIVPVFLRQNAFSVQFYVKHHNSFYPLLYPPLLNTAISVTRTVKKDWPSKSYDST